MSNNTQKLKFKVFRFNKETDYLPHYDTFEMNVNSDELVLDVMNRIKWEHDGSGQYFHSGLGHEITLDWDFFLAAEKMSWPSLNHPTIIFHGNQDDVVPIENSRKIAKDDEHVLSLIELIDGHRMQEAISRFEEAAEILELV